MAWLKVCDQLFANRKFVLLRRDRAGRAAAGDWLIAASWAAGQTSDGVVPREVLRQLGIGQASVNRLTSAGLWRDKGGTIEFHDWEEYLHEDKGDSPVARSVLPLPTLPLPNQPSVGNARAIRVGFGRRYEAARGGLTWPSGKFDREAKELAAWLAANPTASADVMLDNFFDDDWATGAGYPFGALAKDPGKYAVPPKLKDPEDDARRRMAARAKREKEIEIEMGVRKPGDWS